jgi:ParB/RepB/Spo0J family partition protein
MLTTAASCVMVEISKIRRPRFKLRVLDEALVANLMKSIEALGLLQPISVRKAGDSYELIFGVHRLEACKRLGWRYIPAIVMDIPEDESFLARVAENLQRNHVINAVEEGRGYKELLKKGWTLTRIAKKIGMSDSYVFDRINLYDNLDPSLKEELAKNPNGFMSVSHAVRIASIKNRETQRELAKAVEKEKLSVRQLEKIIQRYRLDKEPHEDVSLLVEMYNTHPIWKWKNGFFEGPEERVCVLRVSTLNTLLDFASDKCLKIGKICGSRLNSLISRSLPENHALEYKIREFNKRTGFGYLRLKNGVLELVNPAIESLDFVKGYLEGLLEINVEEMERKDDRLIIYFNSTRVEA